MYIILPCTLTNVRKDAMLSQATNAKEGGMDAHQKGKLERYFKNSSRFLWGLVPSDKRNQKQSYEWLRRKGYRRFKSGPYDYVMAQLLDDGGIERLLTDVVIPRVRELLTTEQLGYLRECWKEGRPVQMADLHRYGIRIVKTKGGKVTWDYLPFIEVNTQYNYIEKWGEFAGLWFEEIEEIEPLSHK